jgi:YfiR/HmsC-like
MMNEKPKLKHQNQDCYMRLFKFLLIASVISITPLICFGQPADVDLEAQVKSAYIYNFTKFLDWKQNNSEYFSIIVLGKNNITGHLYKIANKEKINGKAIVVNEISDLYDLGFCNILYLPTDNKDLLYDTLKKIKGKKILLVTNSNGFAEKGAAINFLQLGNKIKFEINRKALESAGIIPNSSLLSLAFKLYE